MLPLRLLRRLSDSTYYCLMYIRSMSEDCNIIYCILAFSTILVHRILD